MGPGRKRARAGRWLRTALLACVVAGGQPGLAPAQDVASPILTLDQERFFIESAFGRAALERERLATNALELENKQIESELVAEEQALTQLRKTLSPEEFTARANAFDDKVERIRTAQDEKARLLGAAREADRKAFLQVAVPILGELLGERQAVAIVDKGTVILSLSAIDVTDEAIAKVDAALAEAAPVEAPAPDPAAPDPAAPDPAAPDPAPQEAAPDPAAGSP